VTKIASRLANRRVTARHFHDLADLCRALAKDLFDPYRPELHYMRGPGPKWRAKYRNAHARLEAAPALAWSAAAQRRPR
jgi:hypothetical protein